MSHTVKPSGPSRRRPTQADVAALAGVSTATVSHILSGRADRRGSGNEETRRRVQGAMEELGYRPNWAGRALRRQRTGLVGAVVSAPSNPWRENLVAHAQVELARHDLDLVVFPDARPGPALDRVVELLDRRAVDACFTVHLEEHVQPSHLADRPIPVIAFAESGFEGVSKVRHGYAAAAAECARTLAARGIRRFLLVLERESEEVHDDFVRPIQEVAADRAGSEVTSLLMPYRISGDLEGMPWHALQAATAQDPIAVLCISDRLAIQILGECLRRGIVLGRDIGVVGRGDLEESARLPVPLSTLGTDDADYSEVFAALAEAAASGHPIDREWTFPWRFIERESTAGVG